MYRVHLTTGATVLVPDFEVGRIRDAMRSGSASLVECTGATHGGSNKKVQINPAQVALLEQQ
jgi:hypothetical protein